jgi:ABC-2 type transport system ATP-binding protein
MPSSSATVSKSYDEVLAVDSLTLSVPRGSIYGFIGPNGSGKTTTLRMIMNILMPDRGTSRCWASARPPRRATG